MLMATAPLVALAVLAASLLLWFLIATPIIGPSLLLVLGLLLTRPTIFGESLSPVGIALCVVAAVVALLHDRGPRIGSRSARSLIWWVAAYWIWVIVLTIINPGMPAGQNIKGLLSVVGVVIAAALVCARIERQVAVVRMFVTVALVLSASAVVTAGLWMTAGVGAFRLAVVDGTSVFLPFTIAGAPQFLDGLVFLPRFFGVGREPALMAVILIAAYFLTHRAGWDGKRWMKILLFAGLVLAQSTTGFAIFAGVWVVRYIIFRPGRPTYLVSGRTFLGLLLLGLGGWAVFNLPLLGVEAKAANNADSITDRLSSAVAGLTAAYENFLGALTPEAAASQHITINLLASIALVGVPGFALAVAAFLRPLALADDRQRAALVVMPLFLTSLLTEPTTDAPLWWCLVLLGCGAADRTDRSGKDLVGRQVADGELPEGDSSRSHRTGCGTASGRSPTRGSAPRG